MSGNVLTRVLQRAFLVAERVQELTQPSQEDPNPLITEAVEAGNSLRRFAELGDVGWSSSALASALTLADSLSSLATAPDNLHQDGYRTQLREAVNAVLLTMPTAWHSSQTSPPQVKSQPSPHSGLNSLPAPNNAFDVVILQTLKVVNDLLEADAISEDLQSYPNMWTINTVQEALKEELGKVQDTGWSEEGMSNIRRLATLLGNRKRYPEDSRFIQAAAHLGTRILLSMPSHFRGHLGDRVPRLIEELRRPPGQPPKP